MQTNYIASPKSARISTNNLSRAMPNGLFGTKVNPVIKHNDGKFIKLLGESIMQVKTEGLNAKTKTNHNEKLFTAEELGAKLGISTSYVYAKLSKLEAQPAKKVGKQAFYSGNLIEKMGERQRRNRRAIPVSTQEFQAKSKEHLQISQNNSSENPKNLMDRVASLEKQLESAVKHYQTTVEKLSRTEQELSEVKKVLGIK